MTIHTRLACAGLATLLLLAGGPAMAADSKIYRCGPDGREYSQVPCKDGREINAADPRSDAQRKAAADVTRRDDQLAEKMARERQAREAAAGKQTAINVGPAKPPAAAASAAKVKQAKPKKKPPSAKASAPAQR